MKRQKSFTKYKDFEDEYYNTEGLKTKPKSEFEDLRIDHDMVLS